MSDQKEFVDSSFNFVIMCNTIRCEAVAYFSIKSLYLNQDHMSSKERLYFVKCEVQV